MKIDIEWFTIASFVLGFIVAAFLSHRMYGAASGLLSGWCVACAVLIIYRRH